MRMNFNDAVYALSVALDCVEAELVGVATGHGKRTAYITAALARELGKSEEEAGDLSCAAVLHDCALTEYLATEYDRDRLSRAEPAEIGVHCVIGERNTASLPYATDMRGAILYHHENADGSGPFGLRAAETPLGARLIHFADALDARFRLGRLSPGAYESVAAYVRKNRGRLFDAEVADAFFSALPEQKLAEAAAGGVDTLLKTRVRQNLVDPAEDALAALADLFARIIDYKSAHTSRHSRGIAEKAARMAAFYGCDDAQTKKLYFAGAVHDLGKLTVPSNILEKPGRLDADEYDRIKEHAAATYEILSAVEGFGDVAEWAAYHHEKLDGSGYPFGKRGGELCRESRLMACLDIYQALTEARPYKRGMSHGEAMEILLEMSATGLLDGELTRDIDFVFGEKEAV